MRAEEHATVDRRSSDFPNSWGEPPADEEVRAAWIRRNVTRGLAPAKQLEQAATAAANRARLAQLEILRHGPGEE